jgi:hypothetical protein
VILDRAHSVEGPAELAVKLPHPERAVVDITKLRDYCLNPRHTRGRHKARVFGAVLGITRDNAGLLRRALLAEPPPPRATESDEDGYGKRYVLDWAVAGPGGTATVRSSWIVLTGEDFPRLTSCYVL